MAAFDYTWLYSVLDIYLMHTFEKICFLDPYPEKKLFPTADFGEFQRKLETAKTIGFSQEYLETWKPKLLVFSEFFQPACIAIFGTDIAFDLSDLQDLLDAFPSTEFWVTNCLANHPRCILLPLGSRSYDPANQLEKQNLLCITYMKPHSEDRIELYKFLHKNPSFHPFIFPELQLHYYHIILATSYFSLAPSGNGYDTFRFWESLCNHSIPIVKQNVFYTNLRHQYPNLPFLCIDDWKDLETLLPTLTIDLYKSMWSNADISCCWHLNWESKLSALSNTP